MPSKTKSEFKNSKQKEKKINGDSCSLANKQRLMISVILQAKLCSSSVPRNSNLWEDAVGAALGLRDHGIKSNSFAVKPELTTIVSSILQAKLDQVDRSKKILEKGNEMHQAAEESLRMVVYLSCWGPN